jgi:hypothetical protein
MAKRRSIKDRLIEFVGGVTPAEASARATRMYEAGYEDGNDEPASGELRTYGYKRATSGSIRDFGGLDYDKVLDTVWRVWLMSPLAKRALEVRRDYIIGSGVQPTTDDESLQEILDEFWAINKMDERAGQFVLQRHHLGEQIFPVFVRETDGQVRIGYIDPIQIHKVIQHPDNCLEKWAVVLKDDPPPSDEPWKRQGDKRRVYRIIRKDEGAVRHTDLENGFAEISIGEYYGLRVTAEQAVLEDWEEEMLKMYGLDAYTGSCFYFSLNDLSNQSRGYSDLLQVVDWIDQNETILFDLADREAMAGFFIADVTLTGATDDQVKVRAKELGANPPKKGSVRVHNDKETWDLNAPDLKQPASVETHRAVETYAWGGLGLPNSWYGHGDDTNLATAAAQGTPTWRSLQAQQDVDKAMFVEMLSFVADQAEIGKAWTPAGEDTVIDLQMPEMTTRDLTSISAALSQLAMALQQAEQAGWMTREHAIEAWAKMMAEIDIEIDPAEEMTKVDAQGEQAGLDGQSLANDWFSQHGLIVGEPEEEPVAIG